MIANPERHLDLALPPDPVAPDSLQGVPRQQTNPARWQGDHWGDFCNTLARDGVVVLQSRVDRTLFTTDAGGVAFGLPHGVVRPASEHDVSAVLRAAQRHRVPVTVRGGGLTTEGESVAFGGLCLDVSSLNRVLAIDIDAGTVRAEAGIFWHTLAETLRRRGMDYLSAPLNLTSSVGGTLGVGGIDINSPRLGCSADQAVALQVVTPTGDIVECSEKQSPDLFERVLLGYGQFGVITQATLHIRPFTPISMRYVYYRSLPDAIADMQMLVEHDAADYCGILTMVDKAINLLVAFDSDEREREFLSRYAGRLRGFSEFSYGVRAAGHYALRPWRAREAWFLLNRRLELFPDFHKPEYMRDGKIVDRTVVFSRAVWRHWGGRQMVIPDLATNAEKFSEAVVRGNEVCRKYFRYYTLYCVGIKLGERRQRYELSSIPPDAGAFAYGCEFEPMLFGRTYSRDHLQSFKNEIYDIGVDMKTSYYRFGGMMKSYIRRALGDQVVEKHLALKRAADPAMILNPDVVF
jgi:FAD/FMN-containing dehydrogenase